jgi:hypothetical protein
VTETDEPYSGSHAFFVVETRQEGLVGYVTGEGLAVGDVLTRLIPSTSEQVGDAMRTSWHDAEEVRLVVERVHAYHQDHAEWSSGMSALVNVSGVGLEALRANVTLATA